MDWDSNSNRQWDNSDTMKEFEKKIKLATELIIKAQQAEQISTKVKQITDDAGKANTAVNSLINSAKNLASDQVSEKEIEEIPLVTPEKSLEEEQELANQSLLEELNYLVSEAVQVKKYKIAYHIERLIGEIQEEGL